jgi:hypothetical protein
VKTPCFEAQEEYEVRKLNGSLGLYETRPRCDENGDFVARKCQPGGRYSILKCVCPCTAQHTIRLIPIMHCAWHFYSCYCTDINNNRIFGESPPTYAANDTAMNCGMCVYFKHRLNKNNHKIKFWWIFILLECSRAHQVASESSLSTVQFPHCLPNGNYDLLQCVNQACFCIGSTNQSLTSPIQPITAIMELPCCICLTFKKYFVLFT